MGSTTTRNTWGKTRIMGGEAAKDLLTLKNPLSLFGALQASS